MNGVVLVTDDVDFVLGDYDYWLVLIDISCIECLGLQRGIGGVLEIGSPGCLWLQGAMSTYSQCS